jgi:hypothetical protein
LHFRPADEREHDEDTTMNFRTHGFLVRTALPLGLSLAAGLLLTTLLSHGDAGLQQPAGDDGEASAVAVSAIAADTAERQEQAGAARSGFYSAPAGQVLHHAFSAATRIALHTKDAAQSSDLQTRLNGTMTVAILDRRADELVARVTFAVTEGTTRHGGQESPLPVADPAMLALATPTLVHMRDDGTTLGYGFAEDVQSEHRNWFRALWSAHRFVARDAAGTWTTREDDVVGTADAEYRWARPFVVDGAVAGGNLHKKKRGYDTASPHGTATVVGTGEAHLNPSIGWLETARMEEAIEATIDEVGIQTTSAFTAEWRLQAVDWQVAEVGTGLWSRAWQPVCGNQERAAVNAGREAAHYRASLAGVTVDRLCADLAAMVAAGAIDSPEGYGKKLDLTWLLRLDPEALARATTLLPSLSVEVAGLLLSAIGASELPAAQALLARVFADPQQDAVRRQAAAWAMVQVQAPALNVVQGFAAALSNAQSLDAGVAAGVLALGTMAGRVAADARPAAMQLLLQLEAPAALQRGGLANWLEALGNAGQAEGLPAALRHHRAADEFVRAAAVSAVRSIGDQAALQIVLAGADDGEPIVRARAAEVLAQRGEPVALPRLAQLLEREPDAQVRQAAVGALAGRAAEPAVAAMLRGRASRDPDAEVRRLAAEALAGAARR